MTKLPDGFVYIKPDKTPTLTFDPKNNRFYLSSKLLKHSSLEKGMKVDIAYNSNTKQIVFDLEGNNFFIDKRGYITTVHYASRIERALGHSDGIMKFSNNDELTNERFVAFDVIQNQD